MELHLVDIIVPVYGNPDSTERCLLSIAEHIQEIGACRPRLAVLNDSPDRDDVRQMLARFAEGRSFVTIADNERNLGFVGTVNIGLAAACTAGRDVILINSDTKTFSGTLRNLVAVAYSDPRIGFVSPRSNDAALCSLPHLSETTSATCPEEAYERWARINGLMPAYHFAPTAVGFYLFIKREVIANVGLFDPAFGAGYEEENDLIFRANRLGYRAAIANHAFAFHEGSASFRLLDIDLSQHRARNLSVTASRYPEYLALVRRYEDTAHYRAEALLATLTESTGRPKIVFDLSMIGPSVNGTSEMAVRIVSSFFERHAKFFSMTVICSRAAFEYHNLDRCVGLVRRDPGDLGNEQFALGIRLAQPFDVEALSRLESRCALSVYAMLDTIAEDCGYLSVNHRLEEIWGHVGRHASGLIFISSFSEQTFLNRHPAARALPRYTRLLPTRLSSYEAMPAAGGADHVLVMGNHFAHKASHSCAEALGCAFPRLTFAVLGKANRASGNLRFYQAGTLSADQMARLYGLASIVVLPSHVEGFGLPLLHALAAGKVVVARDIPATREILGSYRRCGGVFLYRDDTELLRTFSSALGEQASSVEDEDTDSWEDWADALAEFLVELLQRDDLFYRLVTRLRAGRHLRQSEFCERLQVSGASGTRNGLDKSTHTEAKVSSREASTGVASAPKKRIRTVRDLLALNGEEFVSSAYLAILGRVPDSEGLVNYLVELQSGVSKFEILSRLRSSPEGRRRPQHLGGYMSLAVGRRLASLLRLLSA